MKIKKKENQLLMRNNTELDLLVKSHAFTVNFRAFEWKDLKVKKNLQWKKILTTKSGNHSELHDS